MIITKRWLEKKEACSEAIEYFTKQNKKKDPIYWVKHLIKIGKLDWANWFIVRCMKYKQYVSYAVFAAEQVLPIFEKKYPNDDRPRKAIKAARKCIKNPSKANKAYAYASAYADAAAGAAAAAAYAYASAYADASAYASADAAAYAYAAAYASADARKELRIKILKYGIKLLEEE